MSKKKPQGQTRTDTDTGIQRATDGDRRNEKGGEQTGAARRSTLPAPLPPHRRAALLQRTQPRRVPGRIRQVQKKDGWRRKGSGR